MIRSLLLVAGLTAALVAGATPATFAFTIHVTLDRGDGHRTAEAFARSRVLKVQYASTQRDTLSAAGTAGRPIPLRLDIPEELRKARFLVIRGIPQEIALSSGIRVGMTWYVSYAELTALTITSPADFTGNFIFDATLFNELKGGPIGQIYITVAIRAQRPAVASRDATGALGQASGQTARANPERSISPSDEQASLARGAILLGKGDVATARLVFLHLARQGSGPGARAMGETFDPMVLSRILIAGLKPNLKEATKWYRLAVEMGDKQATERLIALGQP